MLLCEIITFNPKGRSLSRECASSALQASSRSSLWAALRPSRPALVSSEIPSCSWRLEVVRATNHHLLTRLKKCFGAGRLPITKSSRVAPRGPAPIKAFGDAAAASKWCGLTFFYLLSRPSYARCGGMLTCDCWCCWCYLCVMSGVAAAALLSSNVATAPVQNYVSTFENAPMAVSATYVVRN